MKGMTRVTALDIDGGESESVEITPDQYVVICGSDRFVAHEQLHANGTTVITIKRHGKPVCCCTKFADTKYRIADLTCAIHGVNGTNPGDGYWEEGE